jgi:hypothetical protein
LLTTNAFLRPHGLSDFSVLRPKAVLTGAIVVGSLSVIAIYPARVVALFIHGFELPFDKKPSLFKKAQQLIVPWLVLVLSLWLMAAGSAKFLTSVEHLLGHNILIVATELYLSAVLVKVLGIQLIRSVVRSKPFQGDFIGIAFAWTKLAIWTTTLCVAVALYITVFVNNVYIHIPREYGGGKPDWIQFELHSDSAPVLSDLGTPFMPNSHTTYPLPVIYESEDSVTVMFAKQPTSAQATSDKQTRQCSIVTISKKLIDASIWGADSPKSDDMRQCPSK